MYAKLLSCFRAFVLCSCASFVDDICWTGVHRKIYQHVIEKERKGDYLGKTVQVWRC